MSRKTQADKTKAPPRTRFQRHFYLMAIGLALVALVFMFLANVNRSDNLSVWDLALCAPFLLIPMIVAITIWAWEGAGRLGRFLYRALFDSGNHALEEDKSLSPSPQRDADAVMRLSLTSIDTDDTPHIESQELKRDKRL